MKPSKPDSPIRSNTPCMMNPLLAAATPFYTALLSLCRNTSHTLPKKAQRSEQCHRLKQFAQQAKAQGCSDAWIKQANIVLSAWADELLATCYSDWSSHKLLNQRDGARFNQTRFFNFVKKQKQPDSLDWLELVYVSLSLGFTAGYTPSSHQENQRDLMIEQLHTHIQAQRQRQLGPLLPPVTCRHYAHGETTNTDHATDGHEATLGYSRLYRLLLNRSQSWLLVGLALATVLVSHHWANQRLHEITQPVQHKLETSLS